MPPAPGGCPSVSHCSLSADKNLISKNRHDEVRWREHSGPLVEGIRGAEGGREWSWEEWEQQRRQRDLAWFEALVVCDELFFNFFFSAETMTERSVGVFVLYNLIFILF